MYRVLLCQLVAVLALILESSAYIPKTLNCSDSQFADIINLDDLLDDTFVAGTTLFYTKENISTAVCPSQQILNISNGTTVSLRGDLHKYCDDQIVCDFHCSGDPQKWLTLRVPIRRINSYQLKITGGPYTVTVPETAEVGVAVPLLKGLGVIADNCQYGTELSKYTGRYSISQGNGAVPFEWSAVTRNNSLHVSGALDYEQTQSYNVTVEAMLSNNQNERLNGTATTTILVNVRDVDDNNPRFNISQAVPYRLQIPEHNSNYTNKYLATNPPVYAYDPDFGINMNINYSILVQEDPGLFEIDNGGFIKVTRELDYEKKSDYRLLIQAAQTDKPDTATAVATLEVNVVDIDDHPPEFKQNPYHCIISEHSTVGSVICTVTAIDNDTTSENNNFTYMIWTETEMVSISNQGKIVVQNSSALDRETTGGKLTLEVGTRTVSGMSGGNATVEIDLVDINDNNPVFEEDTYSFSVTDISDDAHIGKVHAVDRDNGLNALITYTMIPTLASSSCTGSQPSISSFFVNSSTGELKVVDHEVSFCRHYVLSIKACDKGVNRRCNFTNVEISLRNTTGSNNETQTINVLEELPANTFVAPIECSGTGHSYEYRGGPEFTVDNKGVLKTMKILDRETNDSYNFVVEVKMFSTLLCNVNVSVTVQDVNDNSPEFSQTFYEFILHEGAKENDLIGKVEAVDRDLSLNGNISYFTADQRNSPFHLDQLSGEIRVKGDELMNEDITQAYVKAIDNGIPPRESSVIVYIIGETSHSMIPISTPLVVDDINRRKIEIERQITTILNTTIEIGKVEEVKNKSLTFKSRIHIRSSQNSTVSKQFFLSHVLAHYEDIRSLFYESSANTGTDKHTKAAIGPSEIGLIVMAAVILAGAVLAIFIVHRQFNSHKKYKQLYDSMTRNSSLYESQEITVNIPDDGPDCNGTVRNQDFKPDDTTSSPVLSASAVNPVYHSETDLNVMVDQTQEHEDVSNEPQNDNTEVKTALQQLTDSYHQGEDDPDTTENETVVYANVNSVENSEIHDYVNTNVVFAQIESAPEQEEGKTCTSTRSNKDLITFDSESNGEADEQMDEERTFKSTNDESEEPQPDYNEKQVRFHSEVLDADENILEPLKVKTEDTEVSNSPEEPSKADTDTTTDEVVDETKIDGTEPDSETQKINMNFGEVQDRPQISDDDDADRLEEEINSPEVPYYENIQDEFYFGDMVSTHF